MKTNNMAEKAENPWVVVETTKEQIQQLEKLSGKVLLHNGGKLAPDAYTLMVCHAVRVLAKMEELRSAGELTKIVLYMVTALDVGHRLLSEYEWEGGEVYVKR